MQLTTWRTQRQSLEIKRKITHNTKSRNENPEPSDNFEWKNNNARRKKVITIETKSWGKVYEILALAISESKIHGIYFVM